MKNRMKRITAFILCISLIVGIENFTSFDSVFRFINHKITTMGAVENETGETGEESTSSVISETETEEETEETSAEKVTEEETTKETAEAQTEGITSDTAIPRRNYSALSENSQITAYAANAEEVTVTEATEYVPGGIYLIKSYADWNKLSEISQTSDLEGMTFIAYKRDSKYDDWTLSNLKIGCKEYPFAGTLYSYYSTTTIYSNTVLFDYLSSKAHIGIKDNRGIKTFVLSYSANVVAGLANNLVIAKEGCDIHLGGDEESNYYVKVIKGTVQANNQTVVGGMFAHVYVEDDTPSPEGDSSIYKISISGTGIDLSGITGTIQGRIAGGLIGELDGQIDVMVEAISQQITGSNIFTVNSLTDAAGWLVGKISGGVNMVFTGTEEITLAARVQGNGSTGGMVGYIEDSSFICTSPVRRTAYTSGSRFCGGMIGYAYNSSVVISDYTQNNDTYIYQTATGAAASHYSVGGVIGKYKHDNADREDVLDISYIKSENKNAAVSSNIKITTINSSNNKAGGLVGIIDGGNAHISIHDINTDTDTSGENSYNVNVAYYSNNGTASNQNSDTGGLAGVITGEDIVIDNIIFNYVFTSSSDAAALAGNTLAGGIVGDIAGKTGSIDNQTKNTKITVRNVAVRNSYVYRANNYHGGLFGYVHHSIIALQGNVDLSGVPYKTSANGSLYASTGGYMLLAARLKRGFVAGYAGESVIYRDTGCNYTRPVTYDEDGIIKEFDANAIHYTNTGTNNTGSTYLYCIDDIGSSGSLYQNVENVLDISQPFGYEVTGKVDRDGNGNYMIDSLGDALRLSIAGHSADTNGSPVFGGNCFVEDGEDIPALNTIMAADYRLTTDLNMKDAGIHGFISNYNVKYFFTGSFEGVPDADGNNPVISIDFISRQKYGGLFPGVKNAVFKNLDIDGYVFYTSGVDTNTLSNNEIRAGAGSIAAYASDTIRIDNVNIYTGIKESMNSYTTWDNGNMYCYGGMFGYYNPYNGTYTCENSTIAPSFTTIRTNAFTGGMIGWVYVTDSSKLDKMEINNCTLGTSIVTDTNYNFYNQNANHHGRSAGLIALISSDYYDVGSTANTYILPANVSNTTKANITINNMTIDGAEIDLTNMIASNSILINGGFLGYAWVNCDVDINGLAIENSVIKGRGVMGGLISFAAGRYDLNDIEIKGLTMERVDNSVSTYSSFLIGNGQHAFVTVKNYTIARDGNVSAANYSDFDEIVGINLRLETISTGKELIFSASGTVSNTYQNGGIVNIMDDDFSTFESDSYRSYTNQVMDNVNRYTRYYYNLFTENADWVIPVSGDTAQISSEEQWLTFHLALYAGSNIARFIKPYLGDVSVSNIKTVNIMNDLDMTGYSIYPTPLSGSRTIDGGGHTITLYGEEISDLEKGIKDNGIHAIDRNNELNTTQHYMMHASLFNEMSGTNTICNMVLKGTAANIGVDSGALAAGGMIGNVSIQNITLDGLRIGHYSDTKCGLLISHIGTNGYRYDYTTNVTIDGITTINYPEDDGQTAGAALIGYVGSSDAYDVKVIFKNMKVEDEKTADGSSGKVFKYASYVYDYAYTTQLDENRCYMLYTFVEQDCIDGGVTYGDEIKAGVQYYDKDRDKDDTADLLNIAIENAKNGIYIPYVYTERNIFVNPRNGNITEGCGTYEDPYLITNAKQFLTLYLYLTGKSEYNTMFLGTGNTDDTSGIWKVVPIGGDGDGAACSNGGVNGTHDTAAFGTADFPTRDDLRTAYYKICTDIALSDSDDLNDKYIAGEFCGLGSESYPFAGVIIGTGETANYRITLPKQGTKNIINADGSLGTAQLEQSTFGLIQYMSGAVIKDLDIVAEGCVDGLYYNITDCAGGVAAKIVGGDNIIDNVTVSVNFNTYDRYIKADGTEGIDGLGGYVGTIDNGSLILRNIQGKNVVENCIFTDFTNMTTAQAAVYTMMAESEDSPFCSMCAGLAVRILDNESSESENGISAYSVENDTYQGDYDEIAGMLIGMVYDGYVVYEGYTSADGSEPRVLTRTELEVSDKYGTEYPLVNGFHIINANCLDSAMADGRLTFTKAADKEYTVEIKNGDQLEILALALNSDSLSVYYCPNNDHATGYGYKAKCRKAQYDSVGEADSVSGSDRAAAYAYDDNKASDIGYLYPYICYNYMDYTALSSAGSTSAGDSGFGANNYEGYKTTLSAFTKEEQIGNNQVNVTNIVSNVNKAVAEVADYTTTYKLTGSGMFDVSEYDISFRGIGAIYSNAYSDFRANFDGQNREIKYYMTRAFDDDILYSGLFNQLLYNQRTIDINQSDKQLEIKNFTIKNSIVYNPNKFSQINISNAGTSQTWLRQYGITTCATGALAGEVKGAWIFNNITLSRDEAITDDTITSDVSGYRNVGGLIGRISSTGYYSRYATTAWLDEHHADSNRIDIIGCKVQGDSDKNVDVTVTELGSTVSITTSYPWRIVFAGGLVGSIGTNLIKGSDPYQGCEHIFGTVNFKYCSIDGLTLTAENKGNMGGFAGAVGLRYNANDYSYSGWGTVGIVTVDGEIEKEDDDGNKILVNSSIKNLNFISGNASDDYSVGGIFGRLELPRNYINQADIRNYDIVNIKMSNTRTSGNKTRNAYDGDGGVVGYSRSYSLTLNNIHLSGDNQIGYDTSGKDTGGLIGETRPTGNSNGNFGQYRTDSSLNIDNCSVAGTKVYSYSGYAGGYVGMLSTEKVNIGSADTTNSVTDSEIKTIYFDSNVSSGAGGMLGDIYTSNMMKDNTSFNAVIQNATVRDTNVNGGRYGTGGVIGYAVSDRNITSPLTLKNVYVYSTASKEVEISGTSLSGTCNAGGLLGNISNNYILIKLEGNIGVGTFYQDGKEGKAGAWSTADNTGVNIKGQYSGGVIGYQTTYLSEEYTADIVVANNRIYSYVSNTSAQPFTYSGGLFGYRYNYSSQTFRTNRVTVRNNVIFTGANNANRNRTNMGVGAGGLFGYINNGAKATIYMPYVTLENNSIGYYAAANADKAESWKTVELNSSDVKLYKADPSNNTLSQSVSWKEIDSLDDSNIGLYSLSFGQFIGCMNNGNSNASIYILRPEVTCDSTLGSIPVVDVGNNAYKGTADQSTVTYQEGYPYEYRKNCHIVYMDTPTEIYKDISTADSARKPVSIEDSLLVNGKKEYFFGDFADMVTDYRNLNQGVTETAEKNYNYIMSKRLNMYLPYNDNVTKYSLCSGDNNYYDLTYALKNEDGTAANVLNGVPVLILDGLDPQAVGDYAAAILTNGGGVVSSSVVNSLVNANVQTMNNFWQVTCENAYIDVDGTIKKIDTTDSRFQNHQTTSIQSSNSNRLKLATSLYDEFIQQGSDYIYTITLLCYTYTCPGSVDTRTETVYIPVFVKEKVTVDSYIRILSNEEYSLNEAVHSGYKDEVHISHDSVYTIYAEFVYDSIRLKDSFKNDRLDKILSFDTTVDVITKGTKFILLDYQTGKSYYYTSDGTEHNAIRFDAFKDEEGNTYVQRNISDGISADMCKDTYQSIGWKSGNTSVDGTTAYTDVGIERFYIVVEPPEEENNSVFHLNVKTEAVDVNGKAVDEFFNKNPSGDKEGIEVTYIPGPTIGFGGIDDDTGVGTEGVTYIKGKISQDEVVTLDANVEVVLKDTLSPYWEEKNSGNTIDSSNTDKYLEVAVTLLDENNDIVAWPSGTNISFNGGAYRILENNLIIYMYKDIKSEFAMNTVDNNLEGDCYYYNINEDEDNADMRWLHKDDDGRYFYYMFNATEGKWTEEYCDYITEIKEQYLEISNQCNVTLDFSVADLDEYSGKNYTVVMKLFRSDSPEYPNEGTTKSYGESKRQYSGIISGESKKELAAAIAADDLMDLGINTYTKGKTIYDIPFSNRFDFSGLIHKNRVDTDIEECASKQYMVTYRIYKKVVGNGSGEPDHGIDYNDDIASIISSSDGYEYQIMDWEDAPFTLYDAEAGDTPLASTDITVNTNQTQSVIITSKSFTADEIKNGTEGTGYVTKWGMNLKADIENMQNEDLTNYMVTATYVPYDDETVKPETDEQETLFDYFIFTIAKLKTDM